MTSYQSALLGGSSVAASVAAARAPSRTPVKNLPAVLEEVDLSKTAEVLKSDVNYIKAVKDAFQRLLEADPTFTRRIQTWSDATAVSGKYSKDEGTAADQLRAYCKTLGGIYADLANDDVVNEAQFFEMFRKARNATPYSRAKMVKRARLAAAAQSNAQ